MADNDVKNKFSIHSLLGKPIETAEQAAKARKKALLGLLIVASFQAALGILFWYLSTTDSPLNTNFAPIDAALLFLILAAFLYFYNSRIAALILAAIAIFNWVSYGLNTGDFLGSGIRIILLIIAIQVAVTVFKIHKWKKKGANEKIPKSKAVIAAMIIASMLILGAIFVPPIHFLHYTRSQISLTEKGNVIEYNDHFDLYSFVFPKTWEFKHPDMEYGAVHLHPMGNENITVKIERWTPWDVPAVALFNQDKFLEFAVNEANKYATETGAKVESVKIVALANINGPRAIYIHTDGYIEYVQYIYNRAWSRKTSDGAFFFWKITAKAPFEDKESRNVIENILSSFSINQNQVK